MNEHVRQIEEGAKDQFHQATASSHSLAEGMKALMEQYAGYAKRSMEETSSFFQTLYGQRSLENIFQLQANFVHSQSQAFVEQCQKTAEIYQAMTREAMKPVQSAAAKVQNNLPH